MERAFQDVLNALVRLYNEPEYVESKRWADAYERSYTVLRDSEALLASLDAQADQTTKT